MAIFLSKATIIRTHQISWFHTYPVTTAVVSLLPSQQTQNMWATDGYVRIGSKCLISVHYRLLVTAPSKKYHACLNEAAQKLSVKCIKINKIIPQTLRLPKTGHIYCFNMRYEWKLATARPCLSSSRKKLAVVIHLWFSRI